MGAAAAALLSAVFGIGVFALSGAPSGAVASTTLYVDNVKGAATTLCTSPGAGACKTIQEGVTAAQLASKVAAPSTLLGLVA